jgi:hypothetical protein
MALDREVRQREREFEAALQFTPEGHLARGNAWRAKRRSSEPGATK